jgi:hypothetical protein
MPTIISVAWCLVLKKFERLYRIVETDYKSTSTAIVLAIFGDQDPDSSNVEEKTYNTICSIRTRSPISDLPMADYFRTLKSK